MKGTTQIDANTNPASDPVSNGRHRHEPVPRCRKMA